ncbi:hypothetical protein LCGC14_2087070, partial [marine sediment metagenome]
MKTVLKGIKPSRRSFLRGALATGGALAGTVAARAATPDPAITELQ